MTHRFFSQPLIVSMAVTFLLSSGPISIAGEPRAAKQILMNKYHEIKKQLFDHPSGLPIYIASHDDGNILSGNVYSIVPHSFPSLRGILIEAANWCDISLLHLNIKACTYQVHKPPQMITFYSGRKFYQPPEDAFILEYRFQVAENQPQYVKILLTADDGPLDTSDYRIEIEAMPVDGEETFIRFSYTYQYGLITQTATEGYLVTLGRNKIGFTIIDHDENGDPVYIEGTRGAIERNAVRYYLAIRAYMDSLQFPEENRFDRRVQLWYEFTDRFKKHLFELPREEYINGKRSEYQNQIKLQEQMQKNAP